MSTSGTHSQMILSTAKVLEHALRRTGIAASNQTIEHVEIAKECLFLLLSSFTNKGPTLWAIENLILGFIPYQRTYLLPSGTLNLLNVSRAIPTLVDGTYGVNYVSLPLLTRVQRVGIKFSVLPTADFTITSNDGVTDTVIKTCKVDNLIPTASIQWFDLDPSVLTVKVTVGGGTIASNGIYLATGVSEIHLDPFNRDDYSALPNRSSPGTPTNYFYEKLITPQVSFWQVPIDPLQHANLWIHREVQDVGGLTQNLAIPKRWYEAIIVKLASSLSMELPGVNPDRIKMLLDLSDKFVIDADDGETDGAPVTLRPNISPYTK